jgi:hypothetical protein
MVSLHRLRGFWPYMKSKNKYIDNLKSLVLEYLTADTRVPERRAERAVLNVIGEISKILFGTLTQSDA